MAMVATSAAAAVITTVLMIPRFVGRLERFGATFGAAAAGVATRATGFGLATSTAVDVTARDVPAVDADAPYGAGAALPPQHHEMQPALQIFLRYADLGPGDFQRTPAGWQPA